MYIHEDWRFSTNVVPQWAGLLWNQICIKEMACVNSRLKYSAVDALLQQIHISVRSWMCVSD